MEDLPKNIKNGYYIEVRNKYNKTGVKNSKGYQRITSACH